LFILVQLGDDGNKENIDLLGQQIRLIRMMKGVEVGADVGQGKVVPITFQADSCNILVRLDARVYYAIFLVKRIRSSCRT